jgi:hypothetical protein
MDTFLVDRTMDLISFMNTFQTPWKRTQKFMHSKGGPRSCVCNASVSAHEGSQGVGGKTNGSFMDTLPWGRKVSIKLLRSNRSFLPQIGLDKGYFPFCQAQFQFRFVNPNINCSFHHKPFCWVKIFLRSSGPAVPIILQPCSSWQLQ